MSLIPCITLDQPQLNGHQPFWPAGAGDQPPEEADDARVQAHGIAAYLEVNHLLPVDFTVVMLNRSDGQCHCWGLANGDTVLVPVMCAGESSSEWDRHHWYVFERIESRVIPHGVQPSLAQAVVMVLQMMATLVLQPSGWRQMPGERAFAVMQRRVIRSLADTLKRYGQD